MMQPVVRYATVLCLSALLLLYSMSFNFDYFQTLSNHPSALPKRHPFNCRDILDGRLSEIRRAERWLPDHSVENASCLQLPAFSALRTRDSESSFPLAFTIIAYKNPGQLRRLLRVIYRPWNSYCIHLDQKADPAMVDMVIALSGCHSNVWLAEERYDVRWGRPTLLHAAISCQRVLYSKSDQWVYLLNIAASDFPLLSNYEIVQALRSLNGSSDVQLADMSWDHWKYEYSFANADGPEAGVEQLKKAMAANESFPTKAPPPFGLIVRKGSFSVALHRDFIKFLIHDPIASTLLQYLNDTFIADEAYWSTLYHGYFAPMHRLSPQRPFQTRYTHWGSYRPSCGGYYEHGLCVFGVRDLRWLLGKDKGYFFAHKFDELTQPMALGCLEEYVFNKTYSYPLAYCGCKTSSDRFLQNFKVLQ